MGHFVLMGKVPRGSPGWNWVDSTAYAWEVCPTGMWVVCDPCLWIQPVVGGTTGIIYGCINAMNSLWEAKLHLSWTCPGRVPDLSLLSWFWANVLLS